MRHRSFFWLFWLLCLLLLLLPACDLLGDDDESPEGLRGDLLDYTFLESFTDTQLEVQFALLGLEGQDPRGVDLYQIRYLTIDPTGDAAEATGLVVVPTVPAGALPTVSYQHLTVVARDEAPSVDGFERLVGAVLGATGYAAVLPDYLGLGDSDLPHPFLHAETEASAVVDMLRASATLFEELGVSVDGRLLLSGYSQGGHATLAAQRALQTTPVDPFTLIASAPMAGAYDLSGELFDFVLNGDPFPNPYYLPFTILSYDRIYDLYDEPEEYFVEPYDSTLPRLFDGTRSGQDINESLPDTPLDIFQPDVREAITTNPAHPFRLALADNDVYDFASAVPTRLVHCAADDNVPFSNAEVAVAALSVGATASVDLVDPFPAGTHRTCFIPALRYVKSWFDALTAPPAG